MLRWPSCTNSVSPPMLIFIKESRCGAGSWETECSLCLCPQLKKQSEVFVARVPGPGPGTAQMATRQPPGSWASTGPWIIMSQDISAKQRLPRPRHCVWGWWWWGASLIKIIWDLLGIGDLFFQLCVNFSELYEESSPRLLLLLTNSKLCETQRVQRHVWTFEGP